MVFGRDLESLKRTLRSVHLTRTGRIVADPDDTESRRLILYRGRGLMENRLLHCDAGDMAQNAF